MLNRTWPVLILVAASAWAQEPATSQEWVKRGIQLVNSGRYPEAADAFQNAVDRDPKNLTALRGLASLAFNAPVKDPIDRSRELDEAARWNNKILDINPKDQAALYFLGVIAWTKAFPDFQRARSQAGMKPEDPGPITDFSARQDLRARFGAVIDDGIANLQKALAIDSAYSDAMAYLNLLLRERADIRDTPDDAKQDLLTADDWAQKALAAKKAGAGVAGSLNTSPAPPPPPPPPPPPAPAMAAPPQAIRIGGNVQADNLIARVDPVYPPLARQARIQGTVRYNATIGTDGYVQNLQLISGHPLLVASATTAVRQWVYKPASLNGQPVAVITTIDVDFILPPQ